MRLTAATFATALSLGVIALALPTGAVARSGATVDAVGSASIAHPAQDFSAQQRRPRTYTPRTYTPRPAPRTNTAPRYIYPGSRDALDTCAFC
jgi:hypothetical protein